MIICKNQVKFIVFLTAIGEYFCHKTNYEWITSDLIEEYSGIVEIKINQFGPLINSDQVLVNITLEALSECSLEDEDDSLSACLCNFLDCVELYCELSYYLESNQCTQQMSHNNTFEQSTNLKILYIYDNLKEYDESVGNGLKSIDKLDESYFRNTRSLVLREHTKDQYEFIQVDLNCVQDLLKNRVMKTFTWLDSYTLAINLVSFFALVIILLLFTLVTELGNQISGKCWIMYAIVSLRNYEHTIFLSLYYLSAKKDSQTIYIFFTITIVVTCILILRIKSLGYGRCWFILSIVFIFLHIGFYMTDILMETKNVYFDKVNLMFHVVSYFATEFSVYFWLNMICFDCFYSTKAFRMPNAESDSKRFWVYCFVCSIVPIVLGLGVYVSLMLFKIKLTDVILPAAVQRLSPFSTFMRFMTNYLKIIGTTELIIKSITVIFFLSYSYMIAKHKCNLRGIEMTVHGPKPTKFEKSLYTIRMGILTFMILGSLACNLIVYFSNVFVKEQVLCKWQLKWLEDVNPLFELLKRLNGFYVLIYVFSGREYWRVIGKKIKRLNQDFRAVFKKK